ncbi:hypothetical protein R1sor_001107 [Riccia sorocarpa]|uniref:Uncharacterized protein n=1 Tax=Riccia sorocarpa TaxID=122646 RepID=A0ABD3GV07_9MARC
MAPFNLERVKYSDYVLAPTMNTMRIPGLVVSQEELDVWDAVGIPVTPRVHRNFDEVVCYARREPSENQIQNELQGKLLQGPAWTLTPVQDGTDYPSVDGEISEKTRKRGELRHKGHFMKRPMTLAEVIEELKHPELRENALRCLSGRLIELGYALRMFRSGWKEQKREADEDFYREAGYFLYPSSGTMAVLLQEMISVYDKFNGKDLKVRALKQLANVITLLQTIAAANEETREASDTGTALTEYSCPTTAGIPSYMRPFIMAAYTEEVYENIRSLSLSVTNILCQLAMAVMESIFYSSDGVSAICDVDECSLPRFFKFSGDLVRTLSQAHGHSPRLLFAIVRVYLLLCRNIRALEILSDVLPRELQDSTFDDLKKEYPRFNYLIHQLLLLTGKQYIYLIPRTPQFPKQSDGGPSETRTPPGQWNSLSRGSFQP